MIFDFFLYHYLTSTICTLITLYVLRLYFVKRSIGFGETVIMVGAFNWGIRKFSSELPQQFMERMTTWETVQVNSLVFAAWLITIILAVWLFSKTIRWFDSIRSTRRKASH